MMEARFLRLTSIVLLLLTVGTIAKDHLEILPNGEVLTKAIGSSIILTCKPRVGDTKLISDIKWLDPTNRVVDSLSKSQGYSKPAMYTELHTDNSLSLFFNSLREDQAGRYICRASYANTELLTSNVTIETIVAITWIDAPENQFPTLGEDFAIKCVVRARPSPTVDWLYNGEVVRTNDHYIIETHALRIKNVTTSDEGIYTCRASVPQTGELQERSIRVEVLVKPKIEEITKTIEITEGSPASIECKSIGKPPPKYTWVKSLTKENLANSGRFTANEDTGVLTIVDVHRDDSGEYQCEAANDAGKDSITIQVNVMVKPKIMEFENITVSQGNSATLSCKAYGRPAPTVTFRKHTNQKPYVIGAQPKDDRITVRNIQNEQIGETVGELTIDQVLRSNDGLYECIATNKIDRAVKNGHLTVQFPPSFESMYNRTHYSWDMRPVNLTCIAESIPNATIYWTYQGYKIQNDAYLQIYSEGPKSTLQVRPVDRRYYSIYKCVANNPLGEATHDIELREAPKPANVQHVKMSEITATTIAFDITPPDAPEDLPIKTITVQYKPQNVAWSYSKNRTWAVTGPQGTYVVEDLSPQTNYDFRFAAANVAGRGSWGSQMMFTTNMRDVPGLVKFLVSRDRDYVLSQYHDRYNLRWAVAPDNGEAIDYYNIKWCETKKYTDHWEVQESSCLIDSRPQREFVVDRLRPDTYYHIEVRAHNSMGFGPPSNITIRTARETLSYVGDRQVLSGGASIQLVIVNFIATSIAILSLAF